MTTTTLATTVGGFWSKLENLFVETEADVRAVIVKIQADFKVAESEIDSSLKWLVGEVPAIARDVQAVATWIEQTGLVANPEVAAAIAAANIAVQGLNAFAEAMKAGKGDAGSVVSGYVALKSAASANATAAAAAASAKKQVAPAPAAA